MKENKEREYKADILLCDLDAFFASVEQRDQPEYKGKPLLIGGSAETRGVVATCSYEARQFGIRSAMPMSTAVKLCPQAVILPANKKRYQQVSRQVREVMESITPDIETVSIDEAYLQVPKGEGVEAGKKIREIIENQLNLPISVGVSVNKLLAKLACEQAKPNNIKALWPEDVPFQLWPLPVKTLPGVGPATEEKLKKFGVRNVGDLARLSPSELMKTLGKHAFTLHNFALGIDGRAITRGNKVKSISEETTFPWDITDSEQILAILMELAEGVGYRLREEGFKARTISLKLRFADFRTITRDVTLSEGTNRDIVIYQKVKELFQKYGSSSPPWRLAGVKAAGLEEHSQLSLLPFNQEEEKEKSVARVQDALRNKYGCEIVYRAKRLTLNNNNGDIDNKPG